MSTLSDNMKNGQSMELIRPISILHFLTTFKNYKKKIQNKKMLNMFKMMIFQIDFNFFFERIWAEKYKIPEIKLFGFQK